MFLRVVRPKIIGRISGNIKHKFYWREHAFKNEVDTWLIENFYKKLNYVNMMV